MRWLRRDILRVIRPTEEEFHAYAMADFVQLLNKAKHRVVIVSRKWDRGIYGSKEMVQAICAAQRRGVAVTVCVGPGADLDPRFVAQLDTPPVRLPQSPPMSFAVADERHVRIEDSHVRADVFPANTVEMNVPLTAQFLMQRYHRYMDQVQEEQRGLGRSEPDNV